MSPLYVLFCLHVAVLLPSLEGQPNPVRENLYEEDREEWLKNQISFLNRSDFSEIDVPNLVHELQMMAEQRDVTILRLFVRILSHLLKMVCDPFYPSLTGWMRQIENFRLDALMVMEMKGNENMRRELATYRKNADKTSTDRKLTRLEDMLQEAWDLVTATDDEGNLAAPVVADSEDTIRFYHVPAVCPLTLEQILQKKCYPRKAHFGPDLVCEGYARPNEKQKRRIQMAEDRNETLDDFWFLGDAVPKSCPKGFY